MEAYKLASSAITGDGKHVTLTFETDSEPLVLDVNAATLRVILQELAGVASVAQKKAAPDTIQSVPPATQYRAVATEDGKAVIFSA